VPSAWPGRCSWPQIVALLFLLDRHRRRIAQLWCSDRLLGFN
jgi:hypothetical protein